MLSRGRSADERAERKVGRRVDVKERVGLQGGSGYKWVRKSSRRMLRCRHWRRCRETAGTGGKNKAESGSKSGGNRQTVAAKRTSGEEGRRLRRRTEEGKRRA